MAPPVPAYLRYHHEGALMPPEFVGFIKGNRMKQPIIIYHYMPLTPPEMNTYRWLCLTYGTKSESLRLYIQLVEAMRTV